VLVLCCARVNNCVLLPLRPFLPPCLAVSMMVGIAALCNIIFLPETLRPAAAARSLQKALPRCAAAAKETAGSSSGEPSQRSTQFQLVCCATESSVALGDRVSGATAVLVRQTDRKTCIMTRSVSAVLLGRCGAFGFAEQARHRHGRRRPHQPP
jgi:hypothetical protein